MWLVADAGVLRSDDGGLTVRAPGANLLPGTSDVLKLPEPGHLLAAGSDGVWESEDGGVRWRPVVAGLSSPRQVALALAGRTPVVSGDRGIYRLERRANLAEPASTEPPAPKVVVDTPPLEAVVGAALHRPGMRDETVRRRRTLLGPAFVPSVAIAARLDRDNSLDPHFLDEYTHEGFENDWSFALTLSWGGSAFADSVEYSADAAAYYAETEGYATTDTEAYGYDYDHAPVEVVDGEVYIDDGTAASLSPRLANVAEDLAELRTDVAGRVVEIYLSRERLIAERDRATQMGLRDELALALLIDELTARLDVYTDGYFSSALTPSPSPAAPAAQPSSPADGG